MAVLEPTTHYEEDEAYDIAEDVIDNYEDLGAAGMGDDVVYRLVLYASNFITAYDQRSAKIIEKFTYVSNSSTANLLELNWHDAERIQYVKLKASGATEYSVYSEDDYTFTLSEDSSRWCDSLSWDPFFDRCAPYVEVTSGDKGTYKIKYVISSPSGLRHTVQHYADTFIGYYREANGEDDNFEVDIYESDNKSEETYNKGITAEYSVDATTVDAMTIDEDYSSAGNVFANILHAYYLSYTDEDIKWII